MAHNNRLGDRQLINYFGLKNCFGRTLPQKRKDVDSLLEMCAYQLSAVHRTLLKVS